MKILYVDESYDKRSYVVCGFLINDINYRKLNETFNRFLDKEFGLPEDEELKGDELFNGRNRWRDHTMQQRAEGLSPQSIRLGEQQKRRPVRPMLG